jgi:hypothetical protein
LNRKQLDPVSLERKTFILHLISQLFNGLALGVVILQDIILKKTLGGSDFQVMLLSLIVSSAFLFSIYGSEIVNRSYNRAKTILIIGFFSKIFFIILPLFSNPIYYIFCIGFHAVVDSLLLSIWNIVFKHNYTEPNRSRLFSYASTLQIFVLLLVSTVFGNYLDVNSEIYKYTFPVAGICGMLTYYNLAKMISLSIDDYKGRADNIKSYFTIDDYKEIVIFPARDLIQIFRTNKPFLRFEIYFFLYGMAFMVLTPVVPVFFVDNLHLSYSPISIAKGLIFHSALIAFTPIMGKYHSKGNPAAFCGFVFVMLALYPLTLVSAKFVSIDTVLIVYLSHFFYGFAMSGITIAWALSSIYYAPKNEVSHYQAAHITLTGVRGLFAPALGYAVMKLFAIEYTFLLSASLLILGGLLMFNESKKCDLAVYPANG